MPKLSKQQAHYSSSRSEIMGDFLAGNLADPDAWTIRKPPKTLTDFCTDFCTKTCFKQQI